MKVVSVINYKGGVGKTTLTANIAGELASRGYKVLMIDLDPQASLTFSFFTPEYWREKLAPTKTIKSWFKPKKNVQLNFSELVLKPAKVKLHLEQGTVLHLIASHLELINVDLELATKLSGANLQQAKQNFLKVHRTLADGISQFDEQAYDIVLIDCPPNFNIVTKNAIVASDYILIPAKPDYLSTLGIDYLKTSLNALIKEYNEYCDIEDDEIIEKINPSIVGVIFTMIQIYGGRPISTTRPFIAQTKNLGVPVFENYIRENKTLFADAPQYGVPVVLLGDSRTDIIGEIQMFVNEFEKAVLQPTGNEEKD